MTQHKDPKVDALQTELHIDLIAIKAENAPLDELLNRTREELQTVRSLLPEHKQLRNTKDWTNHHAETEQKYRLTQERYAELKTDTAGIFVRDDYYDALFEALSQRKIMEMVINHARNNPAPKQAGGCMAFAVLLLPFALGITWWAI